MSNEGMKSWLPVVIPAITSFMVLFMGVELQDKRDQDRELLNEVKGIKESLTKSAVIFGKINVEITHIKDDITDNSERITTLENKRR